MTHADQIITAIGIMCEMHRWSFRGVASRTGLGVDEVRDIYDRAVMAGIPVDLARQDRAEANGAMSIISLADRKKIAEEYVPGSAAALADEYDVTERTIYRVLAEARKPPPKGH